MSQHKIVQLKGFRRLLQNWQDEANIFQSYSKDLGRCTDMLAPLSSMWEKHFGWTSIAKNKSSCSQSQTLWCWQDTRPAKTNGSFKVLEVKHMLFKHAIESTQRRWADPVVLVPKKDSSPVLSQLRKAHLHYSTELWFYSKNEWVHRWSRQNYRLIGLPERQRLLVNKSKTRWSVKTAFLSRHGLYHFT